jgi:MYXO-CTERM domain-containing protein
MNDCPSTITQPEKHLSYTSSYICGTQVPPTTSTYPITSVAGAPLENGVQYVVAIAAYDQVWNLGPPAPLQCQTPEPVDSFFPTYCAEGGPGCVGGCGSCDVGGGADPLWPVLGAGALAAVGIIVRRDRRRRASRPSRSPEQE